MCLCRWDTDPHTSLTVECWVTQNAGNGWAEIWTLHDGMSYFGLLPDPAEQ